MKSQHWLAIALAAGAVLFAISSPLAYAIPNQHLNPHSDAAVDISWPTPAPGTPNSANHLHLKLRGGETITQGAAFITSNMAWRADSVWDDRFYRFADADNDINNDLAAAFGHGYIDPTFAPRYFFSNVPANAQTILTNTFSLWNAAAQAAAGTVGNQTPAGTPTVTNISAGAVGNQASADFTFLFANILPTQNAFAEWIVSSAQDNPGGPVLAPLTMAYEANPTNSVFFNGDWELRLKDTDPNTGGDQPGAWNSSYQTTVGWHYGAGAPAASSMIDFEYRDSTDPNSIFDSLPAGADPLKTSTFLTFNGAGDGSGGGALDIVSFFPMDFLTIALHETGHVLGLLHDPTSAAGGAANIMRSQIAANASFGNTLRTIDANSAFGAALLYSIPVPEPATLLLAFSGVFCWLRRPER